MRNCGNCFNAHYNLSDRGEELICDESGYSEEYVEEDYTCDMHRYYPGLEEEKNYVFYDESYIAPGYLIINIKEGKVRAFFKIYIMNNNSTPLIGIRAYHAGIKENPEQKYNSIDFSFRGLEDNDNGLFKLLSTLYYDLSGDRVYSIDPHVQGKNNLKLDSNLRVVKMTFYKDLYHGTQHPCDYIDILLGDEYTCEKYEALCKFYCGLSKVCSKTLPSESVKKLLLN